MPPQEEDMSVDPVNAIEDMALSFLEQLSACSQAMNHDYEASDESDSATQRVKPLKLRLVDRNKEQRVPPFIPFAKLTPLYSDNSFKYLTYPRRSSGGSVKPFAQLFRILDGMHESLLNDSPVTKRDVFYKDVSLFKSQRTVDYLVDDLAATLDVERSQLNIRATCKGLVCGSALELCLVNRSSLQLNDTDGTLVPLGEDIGSFNLTATVSWVLIVEKDAIFQHLCRLRITNHPSLPGRGLLITGKGYPDMATRHLVKTLSDNLPTNVPILALVDGDAFGIDILSVYKYGSRALQHENSKLAAHRVKWLGLLSSELAQLDIDRDALIPISKHDEKKALSMLRRRGAELPANWRKELMHMLHSRRKAEIEILQTTDESRNHSASQESVNSTNALADAESNTSRPVAPRSSLLQYLVTKIAAHVTSVESADD